MEATFIVMHRTARTVQLVPVETFVSKGRVKRLAGHAPIGLRVDRAMRAMFAPVRDGLTGLSLKELYDRAQGHPDMEGTNFLAANGQFPNRIIVKEIVK